MVQSFEVFVFKDGKDLPITDSEMTSNNHLCFAIARSVLFLIILRDPQILKAAVELLFKER